MSTLGRKNCEYVGGGVTPIVPSQQLPRTAIRCLIVCGDEYVIGDSIGSEIIFLFDEVLEGCYFVRLSFHRSSKHGGAGPILLGSCILLEGIT